MISCVVPSDVGMTHHATAAQHLGQGVDGPPGELSNILNLLISSAHDDFAFSEHGPHIVRRCEILSDLVAPAR